MADHVDLQGLYEQMKPELDEQSTVELSERTGIAANTLRRVRRGEMAVTFLMICAFAAAVGGSIQVRYL